MIERQPIDITTVNIIKGGILSLSSRDCAIQRCTNPKNKHYKDYGGRGIRICQRWLDSADDFLMDMGIRPQHHTLDRINNETGNYSCGKCMECVENGWEANCAWATNHEQANKRRNSVLVEWEGKTQTATQWERELGLKTLTIHRRLTMGWDMEKILTTKKQKILYDFRGKKMSLCQIEAELGMRSILSRRMTKYGMTLEEAISTPVNEVNKKHEFDGKSLTLQEWANELGVKYPTLYARLKSGKPYSEVFKLV